MTRLAALRSTLAPEAAFTLVELLVAMLTSTVVLGAIFGILVVALHQQSTITDSVQSDQHARTAMTTIVNELQSSCTGFGSSAVQAPSSEAGSALGAPQGPALGEGNSTNLWFISAYGSPSSSNALVSSVTLHDINWTKTGTSDTGLELGNLTDYRFPSSSGEPGAWVFPELKLANAHAQLLSSDVTPGRAAGSGQSAAPLFRYFTYDNEATGSGAGELNTTALSTPLVSATAAEVAEVTVTFGQAPDNGDTRLGRVTYLSNSVNLRFDPTTPGPGQESAPCE